jgi:hypothetical protein
VIFFYCQCTTDSPEYMSEDIQSKSRHMQRIPDCHNKQLLYCVTLLILEQNDISILFKGNSKLNRKYLNCGFFSTDESVQYYIILMTVLLYQQHTI